MRKYNQRIMSGGEIERKSLTISQLETMRSEDETRERTRWDSGEVLNGVRTRPLKEVILSQPNYLSETVRLIYNAVSRHDQLKCAVSTRIASEHYAEIFEGASKDNSIPEKEREAAMVLAGDMKSRVKENMVFDKMYITHELAASGNMKESRELFNEIKPGIMELVDFYVKDIDKKLGDAELMKYLPKLVEGDLSTGNFFSGWNATKERLMKIGGVLEGISMNFERHNPETFYNAIQDIATAEFIENHFSILFAMKNDIWKPPHLPIPG